MRSEHAAGTPRADRGSPTSAPRDPMHSPSEHHLYLLFTPSLCVADPWWTLGEALRGGVSLVQWRPKCHDLDGARRCLDLCARWDVPVIVNDDVELAIELDAAGAHVGQTDMPAHEARRRLGVDRWLGVSTHDRIEVARAVEDGADHLGFGPMFPTTTKGYPDGLPSGSLRDVLATTTLPIFAIGGIGLSNVDRVFDEGCRRIVVGAAILRAEDPAAVATALRRALAA